MATEIERKYLIHHNLWIKELPESNLQIKQAYLAHDNNCTVRIRTANQKAFLTIKGRTKNISRDEFEYEIPYNDAEQLLKLSDSSYIIEKIRHIIYYNNKKWEVDEFLGLNKGLFVAEIELRSEDEKIKIPAWIDKEVTNDVRYRNSYLAKTPISSW